MRKRLSATEQLFALQASGVDYVLMAAAACIPLLLTGYTVQRIAIGLLFISLAIAGLLFSYMIRRLAPQAKWMRQSGWIQLGVAIVVGANLQLLNKTLPGGGFPWQLIPAAYMAWFLVVGCFFLWSDGALLFMVVPGIALFGILSWLETAGFFEYALVLFMASVAVLLTRLHTRTMIAKAIAAGFSDTSRLYSGPWKAMAGPTLAIVSVLVISGFSWFASPTIGSAVRTLAGSPNLNVSNPLTSTTGLDNRDVDTRIGSGPTTSSDMPVLRVTTGGSPPYLRKIALANYRGLGWTAFRTEQRMPIWPETEGARPESNVSNAKIYDFELPVDKTKFDVETATVKSLSRSHPIAYAPGFIERLEYDGLVRRSGGLPPSLADGLPAGKSYYVRAITPKASPIDLKDVPWGDRAAIRTESLNFDSIPTTVRRWAQNVTKDSPTQYDAVRALILDIAKRCKYNLNAERIPGDKDRVEAFLFETNEGYCDLFASALAVGCRAIGIRARPVVGFLLDDSRKDGNDYIVRDRDAHMWVEVEFAGHGWISFDPTEFAESVDGGEVGALMDSESDIDNWQRIAQTGGVVFGIIAVVLVGIAFYSYFRTKGQRDRRFAAARSVYLKFLKKVRVLNKRPKKPDETIYEYASSCVNGNGEKVIAAAEQIEIALYGHEKELENALKNAKELVSQIGTK